MLQILRKKAQSPFIQAIVVIIALVFIFWGVGSQLGRGNREAALVVNGEDISFQQFQQAYDRAYQRLSDQFGGNIPKGLAETLGVKQQVIQQLIQTTLLRQGAEQMGLVVSTQEIQKIIQNMVQFQDNGSFNIERYKSVLAANRMAPTKFEASMKFDKLAEVAAREISGFASVATDFEIRQIYSRQNEKIAVKFVKISPDQFVDKVTIDDKAMKAWFETVKDNYKTKPQIKLKYLTFNYGDIARKVTVDEAKIKEYYQQNLDKYQVPELRRARHILFKVSQDDSEQRRKEQAQKAEEVLKLARSGDDFATLAKKYSEGPTKDSGGELGFFSKAQMVPAFSQAVFSMKPGQISDVVKTQFGYHIIKLEEIKPARTKPLSEVKAEITKTLQQKEAESLAFQMANNAYEGIIGAGSLAKYTKEHPDVAVEQTGFFSQSNAPEDLKVDSQLLDKAFDLNKGELSSLIKGQSGYAIFFVEDRKEPVVPAFADIKDTLVQDYRKAEAKRLAEKAAEKMLTSLREGKDFKKLAAEMGLTVSESGLLGKNEQSDQTTFPTPLLGDVFMLSSASPLPEKPGQDGDDFYVYSFEKKEIPTMPEKSKEVEKYRASLLRFKQQQLLSAWLHHQELNSTIVKNENLK